MQQMPSGMSYVASKPPKWLWIVPVFTMGFLTVIPPIVIAAKLRDAAAWRWTGAIITGWLVGLSMVGSQPEGADNAITNFGIVIYLAAMVGAVVFALVHGPRANWGHTYVAAAPVVSVPPPARPVGPMDPNASAIAGVQAMRKKRADARQLAASDPGLARDLGIGRPDLPRQYDDGGLVDVNSAPAAVLAKGLSLPTELADDIVAARDHLGRFAQAEDLIALTAMTPQTFDQVKDRIILM